MDIRLRSNTIKEDGRSRVWLNQGPHDKNTIEDQTEKCHLYLGY